VLVLLVDGGDRLDLGLERLEDLLVLDTQVYVQAGHRVELRQQLQRLRDLHHTPAHHMPLQRSPP